MTVCL